MKIEEALTISSLKNSFQRLMDEMKKQNEIEVTCVSIDTAGIQFLVSLKKNNPSMKITLISVEALELANILGASKCL